MASRYYVGYIIPKSHCDQPSKQQMAYFILSDGEDYDAIVHKMTKGCEDYLFKEVAYEVFRKYTNFNRETIHNLVNLYQI